MSIHAAVVGYCFFILLFFIINYCLFVIFSLLLLLVFKKPLFFAILRKNERERMKEKESQRKRMKERERKRECRNETWKPYLYILYISDEPIMKEPRRENWKLLTNYMRKRDEPNEWEKWKRERKENLSERRSPKSMPRKCMTRERVKEKSRKCSVKMRKWPRPVLRQREKEFKKGKKEKMRQNEMVRVQKHETLYVYRERENE